MSQQQSTETNETRMCLDVVFLDYLKKVMQPHQKQFNIVDFFQIIVEYCTKQSTKNFESSQFQSYHQSQSNYSMIPQNQLFQNLTAINCQVIENVFNKRRSIQNFDDIQKEKFQQASKIIDKLKQVFIWYKKQTISFQMINNFVLSSQNHILKDKNSLDTLSQYQNLPQRRIRLDQNVKLCIMPQGDSSKIKTLSIDPLDEDNQDIFRKEIFIVTSEYVRSIKVDSQKLAQQGNKTVKVKQIQSQSASKISIVKNWYTYSDEKIMPQSMENNMKDMKISAKKQLYIEKVTISENIIGIITHQKDIFIKPLLKQEQKFQRGRTVIPYQLRLGNMITDIPDQNLQKPIKKDKSKALEIERSKILLFECYNDDIWVVVNQLFVYVYVLPLQNNKQAVNDEQQKSSMLSLCEPLPTKAQQAILLTKQYMAIMTQDCCVMILKLQLSSKKEEKDNNKIYPTNKVYNDIKFICMDYHPVQRQLVFTDFGSYLIRLKFNIANGDIQREGPVYNEKVGRHLTQNTTNTKRQKQFGALRIQGETKMQQSVNLLNSKLNQLLNQSSSQTKNSSPKINKQTLTIWQQKGKSIHQATSSQVFLNKFKEPKKDQDKSGKSIYAKPQNTDYIKIVKNSSRQNMTLLCLNKNNTTLITYEETSVNPLQNGKSDLNDEADVDRLYDKTIKLWDLHYMNVYQTFTLSLQISKLSLQSNGLYIVTKERGYLGFYPLLNKEQQQKENNKKNPLKNQNLPIKTKLGPKIVINGNELFFYTQLPKQRNKKKMQNAGYQTNLLNYNNPVTTVYNLSFSKQERQLSNIQQIPAQISQLDVQNKLYILSDTSGDKRYNLNVYDTLGNKEVVMKANNRTQKFGIIQNYTNFAKINHFQFNVLLWNKRSIKFVGSNLEQSFTVHWTFSCNQKGSIIQGSQFDMRSLKSSSRKQKTIEDICISQNAFTLLQKQQTQLYKNMTLTIFSLQSARIKFRIHDIKSSFKVLSIFNTMLVVQESFQKSKIGFDDEIPTERKSDTRSSKASLKINHSEKTYPIQENQEYINVIDLNSPFHRKCIFSLKFKNFIERNMSLNEIKRFETDFNNLVSKDCYFVQNSLNVKCAQLFSLNKDDSIVFSCVFHVKIQYLFKTPEQAGSISRLKLMKSEDKYFLYTRQISTQVAQKLNYIPRTIDTNVKKKSRKVEFQYVGQSDVHDRILGHWEIDLNQLLGRSTIKNFSYLNDLHSNADHDLQTIIHDISDKIINYAENQKKYKNIFGSTQSILKIYDSSQNFQGKNNQDIKVSWILAEAQSFKSILCLRSESFFQILTQSVAFGLIGNKSLKVQLQKICKVVMEPETDKPVLQLWNNDFNKGNQKIWQETKFQLIEYMKKKLQKKSTKNIPIEKKPSKKQETKDDQLEKIQQKIFITSESPSYRRKAVSQIKPKLVESIDLSSNQINNIFRQWTISKNIEKQLKNYQKNNTETQQILEKQLKTVIENAQIKQQRIKYLLGFPEKIRDPTTPVQAKLLVKNNQQNTHVIDVKSILNSETKQIIDQGKKAQKSPIVKKQIKQSSQNNSSIQKSLLNLEISLNIDKNGPQSLSKTKNSTESVKSSQLKLTERKTGNQKVISSFSLPNQTQRNPQNSAQIYKRKTQSKQMNLWESKNGFKSPIQRTKTENADKNYLELITETPLQSLKSMNKKSTNLQFHKNIYSPNPQSSLSNIVIDRSLSQNQSINNNGLSKIMKSQGIQYECAPNKKNKSVVTRCKTQVSNDDEALTNLSKSALIQLKQSAKTINQTVLPQIKINRQKLNQKMKQKKSFLKSINQRIGSSRQQIKTQIFKKKLHQSLIKLNTLQ